MLTLALACQDPPPVRPGLTASEVFEGATVSVDPRVATVLVVDWHQLVDADAVWLAWSVDGQPGASPERAVAAGDGEARVLGVPSSTEVPLELHARVGDDEVVLDLGAPATGPLPEFLTDPDVDVVGVAGARAEPYLLTSVDGGPLAFFGPCFTVILDALGRVVWYRPTSGSRLTWEPRVSAVGPYLLIDESTTYTNLYEGPPSVSRVTLDGALDEPTAVDGMEVAYDELDDGSLVFGEQQDNVRFYLTRQTPDGARERLWDCFAWMTAYTNLPYSCAPNTVTWNRDRGTVLWSMYKVHTVVEIDLATGAMVSQIGQLPDGYALDPPDAMIDTQHFPNWTAAGTLMVSTHGEGGDEQWARELVYDDAARTVHAIWSLQNDTWARYAGEVRREDDGNVLWELGVTGLIQELTPDGEVLWQVQWPNHLVGTLTPLTDLYALTVP